MLVYSRPFAVAPGWCAGVTSLKKFSTSEAAASGTNVHVMLLGQVNPFAASAIAEPLIRQVVPVCHAQSLTLLSLCNKYSIEQALLRPRHLPTKSAEVVLESTRSCGAQRTVVRAHKKRQDPGQAHYQP